MILGKTCSCTTFVSFPRHFLLTRKQSANTLPNFSSFCSLSCLSLAFQFQQAPFLWLAPLPTGDWNPLDPLRRVAAVLNLTVCMPLTGRNGSGVENYLWPKCTCWGHQHLEKLCVHQRAAESKALLGNTGPQCKQDPASCLSQDNSFKPRFQFPLDHVNWEGQTRSVVSPVCRRSKSNVSGFHPLNGLGGGFLRENAF